MGAPAPRGCETITVERTMKTIRLATRGSDLALAQTRAVARLLREAHPELEVVESIIRTSGDRDKEADLSKSSSPGLFTKELEAALLDHRADAAVHSLKDLPTVLPEGLALAAVLPRADSADVLVSMRPGGLAGLSAGSRVGTGSPRRQAMLLAARHDLAVLPIRGNVPTRLAKLAAGQYDAIILAAAGLVRLGHPASGTLPCDGLTLHIDMLETFLPAPGQGAVAVEVRAGDGDTAAVVAALHDEATDAAVRAEREVLRASGGGCHMALGAKARFVDGELHLEAVVFDAAENSPRHASARGKNPEALGRAVAAKLHDR